MTMSLKNARVTKHTCTNKNTKDYLNILQQH